MDKTFDAKFLETLQLQSPLQIQGNNIHRNKKHGYLCITSSLINNFNSKGERRSLSLLEPYS